MFPRPPPVTKALLIANVVIFLLMQPFLLGEATFEPFMLQPLRSFDPFSPGGNFQPWQLLTSGSCMVASAICSSTCWRSSCSARRWNRPGVRSVS